MQITRIPAQRENKKTRIAVYCRVSTKMEEQEDSLEIYQSHQYAFGLGACGDLLRQPFRT